MCWDPQKTGSQDDLEEMVLLKSQDVVVCHSQNAGTQLPLQSLITPCGFHGANMGYSRVRTDQDRSKSLEVILKRNLITPDELCSTQLQNQSGSKSLDWERVSLWLRGEREGSHYERSNLTLRMLIWEGFGKESLTVL